jgi:hypothetical protein
MSVRHLLGELVGALLRGVPLGLRLGHLRGKLLGPSLGCLAPGAFGFRDGTELRAGRVVIDPSPLWKRGLPL